jgi:hypothetical protein
VARIEDTLRASACLSAMPDPSLSKNSWRVLQQSGVDCQTLLGW